MARYFSILTPDTAIYDGHAILQDSGTAYNGNLCMLSGGTAGTSGSVVISTGSAVGVFYDMLAMTELPTTAELVANIGGKRCNFATGFFEALASAECFYGSSLPTPGTKLYDFGDGTIDATARGRTSGVIGLVVQTGIAVQHKDGAYNVCRVKFNFTNIL